MTRRAATAASATAVVPFPRPPDAGGRPTVDLYGKDFHAWAMEQAALLRGVAAGGDLRGMLGELGSLDYANLAEELEGLANRDRRELRSHLGTIVEHLVKLEFSPARDPGADWRNTVHRAREEVRGILEDSPSLRGKVPELLAEAAPGAVRRALEAMKAHGEREAVRLAASMQMTKLQGARAHYVPERLLDRRWWPERRTALPSRPIADEKRPEVRGPVRRKK